MLPVNIPYPLIWSYESFLYHLLISTSDIGNSFVVFHLMSGIFPLYFVPFFPIHPKPGSGKTYFIACLVVAATTLS